MGGGGGAKDLAKEANFIGVADFDLDLVIVVFEMASLKEALRVLGVDIGNVFLAGVVLPLDGFCRFPVSRQFSFSVIPFYRIQGYSVPHLRNGFAPQIQ